MTTKYLEFDQNDVNLKDMRPLTPRQIIHQVKKQSKFTRVAMYAAEAYNGKVTLWMCSN